MWEYKNKEFDENLIEDNVSFVYIIFNALNDKKYIGKKSFYFKKVLPKNSKRSRRKHLKVQSDWKDYYGSSPELLADIEKLGKENFHRRMLRLCKSKGEASYFEAKFQFETDAILSEEYYNSWVQVKVRKNQLKISSTQSILL